ncbi:hypothetical protein CVT25_013081 [Psilocybe cyanescens]|uniref:Uncharacterized protein n=1 Tax=Psilocybe cyanescens TaxID=93625 RepID=A0A409XHM7_PSICY|nr:hypothetical protein CVT25_013081 [Psilocybe cyanescens]
MATSQLCPSIIDETHLPATVGIGGGTPSIVMGPIQIMKGSPDNKNIASSTNVTNSGNVQTIYNIRYELPESFAKENGEGTSKNPPKVALGSGLLLNGEHSRHTKSKMASRNKQEDEVGLSSLSISTTSSTSSRYRVPDNRVSPTIYGGPSGQPRASRQSGKTRVSRSIDEFAHSQGYVKEMMRAHLKLAKIEHDIRLYMESNLKLGGVYTIPLWDPYPNMNLDPKLQHKHCSLGDVGIFRNDGGFDVLFNVFLSKEENLGMQYRPPPSFAPLDFEAMNAFRKPFTTDKTCYSTANFQRCKEEEISNCAYCFKLAKIPEVTGGALLILPESGATVTFNTHNARVLLEQYVSRHLASWYDLLNASYNHRARPNESLKMIHTCYKSTIWSAVALPKNANVADDCKAKLHRSVSREGIYQWEADESFRTNPGSSHPLMRTYDSEYTVAVEVFSLVQGPKPSNGLVSSFLHRSGHDQLNFDNFLEDIHVFEPSIELLELSIAISTTYWVHQDKVVIRHGESQRAHLGTQVGETRESNLRKSMPLDHEK